MPLRGSGGWDTRKALLLHPKAATFGHLSTAAAAVCAPPKQATRQASSVFPPKTGAPLFAVWNFRTELLTARTAPRRFGSKLTQDVVPKRAH